MVQVATSAPSQRVGPDEMDMLFRMAHNRGKRSLASVVREAITYLYEKEVHNMDEKTKKLKYKRTK